MRCVLDPTTAVARKVKSSTLFLSMCKKSFRFPGIAVEGSTRLLTLFPLLLLASAFKLSGGGGIRPKQRLLGLHAAFGIQQEKIRFLVS